MVRVAESWSQSYSFPANFRGARCLSTSDAAAGEAKVGSACNLPRVEKGERGRQSHAEREGEREAGRERYICSSRGLVTASRIYAAGHCQNRYTALCQMIDKRSSKANYLLVELTWEKPWLRHWDTWGNFYS